jgi:ribonuclease Z
MIAWSRSRPEPARPKPGVSGAHRSLQPRSPHGLGVVVVLAAGVYAMRKPLTLRVMSRVVEANMTSSLLDELPDGLHVALCGAGSPLPDPQRSGPCTAIIAGQQLFIVDSGSGSSRVLSRMRIPQGRIDAVFLTHFHSDHIDGLGELMLQRWANGGRREPAPLYGPTGVEEVARGFDTAYRQDYGYRVAHHGEAVVPRSGAGARAVAFALPADGAGEVLIDRDGVRVTAFRVDHDPVEPAVGYRFDYAGRSVVLSGDTAKSSNLETFARDADLLVHEALAPHLVEIITGAADRAGNERVAKITRDILDYHTTPVEAGESAQAAGARHLLFSHIVPPLLLPPMVEIFTEGVDEVYEGPFTVGQDGTLVTMPAGSDDIDVSVSRGL